MPEAASTDGMMELYGFLVPKKTPLFPLELKCYRENRTKQQGGLGAEQHFKNAWRLMWPDYEWSDWVELIVWAWINYKWINIIGHRRASKTYTSAHVCWLDYCAHPFATSTSLATVNFQGLKVRMWSDLLHAVASAKIQQPFLIRSSTNELRIFPESASHEAGERFQIQGIAVPNTQDAQSRIKGAHAPRRRYFLDEAEDISEPIYEAMGNPMSAPDAKCVKLANPIEKISRFGNECEPKAGWGSISETDLFWETKSGGICLHFDGLQSPNMRGTKIFTGILTRADVEETRTKKGEDSVEWWSQIRGWWPPDGLVSRIFPSQSIEKAKQTIIFDFIPEPCATLDPAFESDDAALHFGAKGKLRDGRTAINGTGSETFKFKAGSEIAKDYQLARWAIERCKAHGIKPENFIMDRSGGGRGVFAIMQMEWSREIQGIDYGGSATDRPVSADTDDICSKVYEKFVTELWFRARICCDEGILGGLGNLNPLTVEDLFSRRYFTKKLTDGTVQVAEKKEEMKGRLGRSPDNGDAFTQFGELLIREGHGPGRAKKQVSGSRWAKARERAVKASKLRHSEANEYAHS